jgi:hypothetical protein
MSNFTDLTQQIMKVLHLTVKKKWFDMIASGEKKEEYRGIKGHWVTRLMQLDKPFEMDQFFIRYNDITGAFHFSWGLKSTKDDAIDFLMNEKKCISFKHFDAVQLTNGYSKQSPSILIECEGIEIGTAKPEWSDNWPGNVFRIKLGEVIGVKH